VTWRSLALEAHYPSYRSHLWPRSARRLSPQSGPAIWAPCLVDGLFAGAAVILASLLAVMVRMVVLDWFAERHSRQAWTAIGGGPDNLAIAPVVDAPDQRDHRYVPVRHGTSCVPIVRWAPRGRNLA
jgi:hypothetical protein